MSLDFYLETEEPIMRTGSGIFVREAGAVVEITREEWDYRNLGHDPVVANQAIETTEVFSRNITHNLIRMAAATGLYEALWRPTDCDLTEARQLIVPLQTGLRTLEAAPEKWRKFDAPNGWGRYEHFVAFVAAVLQACRDYPDAKVSVSV